MAAVLLFVPGMMEARMSDSKSVFKWDVSKYTTHVDAMDKEHQVLIESMNTLFQLNEKKSPKVQLVKAVENLGQKTKAHFASEEKYLETVKEYTGLATHKVIHTNLLANYQKHVDAFKASSSQQLPMDFFNFLTVWLSAHICGIDRKYGEVVKARSAGLLKKTS